MKNITDDKSGDIDSFRWGSMPRKEQENHMSAMIDQYCLPQIHQGQVQKGIHVEPVEGCKFLTKKPITWKTHNHLKYHEFQRPNRVPVVLGWDSW